jgi:hypothetical protein
MTIDPLVLFIVGIEVGHWITVTVIWRTLSSSRHEKRWTRSEYY